MFEAEACSKDATTFYTQLQNVLHGIRRVQHMAKRCRVLGLIDTNVAEKDFGVLSDAGENTCHMSLPRSSQPEKHTRSYQVDVKPVPCVQGT